ncbi:hypothetical protein Hanom_Chr14g01283491 [Helianthus anomalus]
MHMRKIYQRVRIGAYRKFPSIGICFQELGQFVLPIFRYDGAYRKQTLYINSHINIQDFFTFFSKRENLLSENSLDSTSYPANKLEMGSDKQWRV